LIDGSDYKRFKIKIYAEELLDFRNDGGFDGVTRRTLLTNKEILVLLERSN